MTIKTEAEFIAHIKNNTEFQATEAYLSSLKNS